MATWEEDGWKKEDLDKLSLTFLDNIFKLRETQGLDTTIYFAKYLNMVGVNPDNYPIFLKLIEMKNHWVTDAIVGEGNIEELFKLVQPNFFILRECFKSITNALRGGIYEKSLIIFLSIIEVTYKNPLEGYRIYKLTNEDVNNLGKHLNESHDQQYPLNTKILGILDKIASLVDPGTAVVDQKITAVAVHANNIRGKFLDMTKSLNEAIPENLLNMGDYTKDEIPPSSV